MPERIVAIDGPSASGKSSTAAAVARALGFAHLDSGALYRGLTLVALSEGLEGRLDAGAILAAAESRGLRLRAEGGGFVPMLDGESAAAAIRSAEVTAAVSAVSALPELRAWVNARLQALAGAGHAVVVDGRDIGSVVFPAAPVKVFLTATPVTRARRRLSQRGERVDDATVDQEALALAGRDRADASRAVAPLRRAEDAVEVDGTRLSFEEQVDLIVGLAKRRLGLG